MDHHSFVCIYASGGAKDFLPWQYLDLNAAVLKLDILWKILE